MRQNIKKYTIHILATPGLNPDAFDLPMRQYGVIICTNRTNDFIDNYITHNKLVINFPDAEDKHYPGAFNRAHAMVIIKFIKALPDEVTVLYVCCSKGGSRSPAVAAAILKASGRSDAPVWHNPFYTPNLLVYERLCRAFGLFMPRIVVLRKYLINNIEYKLAKRRGNGGKYERWQILE